MPVFYGDYQIPRPVQNVSVSVEPRTTGDGRIVGRVVSVVVSGDILPDVVDGVVAPVASEAKLTAILARQKEIREALAVPGKIFQLQGWDGGVPVRFPAHYAHVDFDDSTNWFMECKYRVAFEGPLISGEAGPLDYVESCSESWQFQEDESTWVTRAVHTINVKGQTTYDGLGAVSAFAWQNARAFAVAKLALGWSEVGDAAWSPLGGVTIAESSAAFRSGVAAWSRVVSDQVDETEGTYSATETFLLSEAPWYAEEQYHVVVSDAEPNHMATVTASGVVHGLFADQGDYAAKHANAEIGLAALLPTLRDKAQAAVGGGFTLGPRPIHAASLDHDVKQGTIAYSYEYNDRPVTGDAWDYHQVSVSADQGDYKVAATVTGGVFGILYADGGDAPSDRLLRARLRWDAVRGNVYAWAVQGSGIHELKPFPARAEVQENAENGSISFTYVFDDREHDSVEETRTFDRRSSRLDGITTITVEGQIKGLRTASPDAPCSHGDRSERYRNALDYWNGIKDSTLSLASLAFDVSGLNPTAATRAESHNDKDGVISYTHEYNTVQPPFSAGALSEVLNIRVSESVPVVAQHAIPGRDAGPIFQPIGTRTAASLTASVEIVYPPGPGNAKEPPGVVDLDQFRPVAASVYLAESSYDWQPTTSRLTKSRTWIYA